MDSIAASDGAKFFGSSMTCVASSDNRGMLITIGISVRITSPDSSAAIIELSDVRSRGSASLVHVTCTCIESGLYASSPGTAVNTCLWYPCTPGPSRPFVKKYTLAVAAVSTSASIGTCTESSPCSLDTSSECVLSLDSSITLYTFCPS